MCYIYRREKFSPSFAFTAAVDEARARTHAYYTYIGALKVSLLRRFLLRWRHIWHPLREREREREVNALQARVCPYAYILYSLALCKGTLILSRMHIYIYQKAQTKSALSFGIPLYYIHQASIIDTARPLLLRRSKSRFQISGFFSLRFIQWVRDFALSLARQSFVGIVCVRLL